MAILERFVPGNQYLAVGIIREGAIGQLWLIERTVTAAPWTATTSLRLPPRSAQHLEKQARTQITQIFGSHSVRDAVFSADLVAGDGKIYVLRLSPRLEGLGTCKLIELATGVDLIKHRIAARD